MISFAITFARLARGIKRNLNDPEFRALSIFFVGLLAFGTLFYVNVEGWSTLNALYFCVATLSTVGYGDITPETSAGKIFTIAYLLTGIGVFVTIAAKIAGAQIQVAMAPNDDETAR